MFQLRTVWEDHSGNNPGGEETKPVMCRPHKRSRVNAVFTTREDAEMAARIVEELITAGHFICCDVIDDTR